MPGNREKNTPVGGFRNHERGIAGQEGARQDEVRSLADGEQRIAGLAVESERLFGMNAGGVDDAFGPKSNSPPLFPVARTDADNLAAALDQSCRFDIVEGCAAEVLEGAQERDRVAGVVELAVVIEDAAAKAFALHAW